LDFSEHKLSVVKTARYYVLGNADSNIKTVWYVCHGYGQLAVDFLNNFLHISNDSNLVVAPEGLHRFYRDGYTGSVGSSWMTKEDRESDIKDYINFLNALHKEILLRIQSEEIKIVILGFSQGTATATRWAFSGDLICNRLILWAGTFPKDVDIQSIIHKKDQIEVDIIAGTNDEFISEDDLESQVIWLKEKEITHNLIRFGGGHRMDKNTLTDLSHLI
jgi:predicted esterase